MGWYTVCRARGDRVLRHGFHSTVLGNPRMLLSLGRSFQVQSREQQLTPVHAGTAPPRALCTIVIDCLRPSVSTSTL